jgi:hypothetical protein
MANIVCRGAFFGDENMEQRSVNVAYYIRNGFSSDEMYLNKKIFSVYVVSSVIRNISVYNEFD